MDGGLSSLLAVSVDFSESHLFFPRIVFAVLVVLFLAVLVTKRREIAASAGRLRQEVRDTDRMRLLGTIGLTVAYFLTMPVVGDVYPHSGLGFYLTSIPYLFLLSLLYLHVRRGRPLLIAAVNAVVAPSVAWYVLARLFNLSLP
ncbi:tripartite tricarboxylate transporter TctB family protein [Azospirillum halopraeferens]|uniref:tripartite tricarboxylate transporter TctB family protein n=1 Tax=Azospirillum halopraeferens TaxID=34010 RepID=UPI00040960EC|nr:tripartite tricarboxylate transporter TctB family protein [Azospirillum halopraeferens]